MSEKNLPVKKDKSAFHGMSIDEVRYRLVYLSLQKEFCKDKLVSTAHKTINSTPFSKHGSSFVSGGGILSYVLKGLSYADYALAGYSAFKTVKGLTSLFRRKKK